MWILMTQHIQNEKKKKRLHEISNLLRAWFHVCVAWLMNIRLNTCNTPICIWLGRTQICFSSLCPCFSRKKPSSQVCIMWMQLKTRCFSLYTHTHAHNKADYYKIKREGIGFIHFILFWVWENCSSLPYSATSVTAEAVSWDMVNHHKSLLLPAAHSLLLWLCQLWSFSSKFSMSQCKMQCTKTTWLKMKTLLPF